MGLRPKTAHAVHVKQTDGAIAAEMLTRTVQKMICFLKTNKSRASLCQRPLIIAHTTAPCAD